MTEKDLTRGEVLQSLREIVKEHVRISEILSNKICKGCGVEDPLWKEEREAAMKYLMKLTKPYSFCLRLPQNEFGVLVLSIVTQLLRIQYTFALVIAMIDMVRGAAFQDVYMDSLSSIASKVHAQFVALQKTLNVMEDDPEAAEAERNMIMKLEREIDENNIVICRQVSVATGGDSNFICYIMRKIVAELEHISDALKEIAEILPDF